MVGGVIPLAVWGGAPVTSCRCADGSLKLFCPGPIFPSDHRTDANPHACCQHRAASTGLSRGSADRLGEPVRCTSMDSAQGKRSCRCGYLDREAAARSAAEDAAIVRVDFHSTMPAVAASVVASSAKVLATVPRHDTDPPVDLVVVLHCFLI